MVLEQITAKKEKESYILVQQLEISYLYLPSSQLERVLRYTIHSTLQSTAVQGTHFLYCFCSSFILDKMCLYKLQFLSQIFALNSFFYGKAAQRSHSVQFTLRITDYKSFDFSLVLQSGDVCCFVETRLPSLLVSVVECYMCQGRSDQIDVFCRLDNVAS